MAASKPRTRTKNKTKAEKAAVRAQLEEMQADGVEVKPKKRSLQPGQIRQRKMKAEARRRKREAEGGARKCGGFNLLGEPCKTPPLKVGTEFDGVQVKGNFCLVHEPDIDQSHWRKRFIGEKDGQTARQLSPMQALAEAVAKAPALIFKPHMEALGLEWDAESQEMVPAIDANGKQRRGATHIGFSREGVAKKSRHKDMALQMKAADGLNDRLFGKPRQQMDLGLGANSGAPRIPPTFDRAMEVAVILRDCGAMPDESDPVDVGDGGE